MKRSKANQLRKIAYDWSDAAKDFLPGIGIYALTRALGGSNALGVGLGTAASAIGAYGRRNWWNEKPNTSRTDSTSKPAVSAAVSRPVGPQASVQSTLNDEDNKPSIIPEKFYAEAEAEQSASNNGASSAETFKISDEEYAKADAERKQALREEATRPTVKQLNSKAKGKGKAARNTPISGTRNTKQQEKEFTTPVEVLNTPQQRQNELGNMLLKARIQQGGGALDERYSSVAQAMADAAQNRKPYNFTAEDVGILSDYTGDLSPDDLVQDMYYVYQKNPYMMEDILAGNGYNYNLELPKLQQKHNEAETKRMLKALYSTTARFDNNNTHPDYRPVHMWLDRDRDSLSASELRASAILTDLFNYAVGRHGKDRASLGNNTALPMALARAIQTNSLPKEYGGLTLDELKQALNHPLLSAVQRKKDPYYWAKLFEAVNSAK